MRAVPFKKKNEPAGFALSQWATGTFGFLVVD